MMILILVIVWFEKLRHLIRVQKNREQYDEILNEVDEVLSKFM
jgi:preprotein translocase subunit YajC